ncbi:ATPase [Xylariomycetidae sp. FL2044]|nr:ATPase [Xylariomycetidae sp. FL2044]
MTANDNQAGTTTASISKATMEIKPTPGSVSSVMNLYRSKKDDDGNYTWVDKYPEDAEDAAENEETLKYAFIVRNKKSTDSRKKLEADSIVIQSPWLKTALADILKDYPGVACELNRLVFEAPFAPFVHRWVEFSAYQKQRDLDATTAQHLALLRETLNYEIGDSIAAFQDYVLNGVITYEHLWMIFQPGAVALSAHRGPMSAFELHSTEYMETQGCGRFLRLNADCVDYDGKTFGRCTERINVSEFVGTKKITELSAFPLSFYEDKGAICSLLTKRGEAFERLAGHHYKFYEGNAITWDREGNEVPIWITGRIVVDITSFNRFSPYSCRSISDWTTQDTERFKAHDLPSRGSAVLTPYHRMLARSRTRGYSLKLKQWLDFYVDQIGEITWNTDAFDRLVLPADQKELVMAFSESQLQGSAFDDVISGKGKGVICLLSGPPGVGKTLTAEAVAESLKVPLHTLSSGDLGSDSWEVEQGLTKILDLVSRWNAILLLDECDVFLEARATHDLERNKVVSIFLRTLEYYEGIMFMTTNRVENMDAAFQSRIHVSIHYPDLSRDSRRIIWTGILASPATDQVVSEAEVEDLSRLDLNGRQIKNIIKTAQLLASRKKTPLRKEFIDTVLAIDKRRPGMHS